MKIKFSIVIPTYKRGKYVMDLLNSLKSKITSTTEIILVEQGENHEKEFFKKAKAFGFQFHYLHVNDPSTPHAKNIGVEKAKGEYIIFLDDDVVVKSSPELYAECFSTKKIAAVNGRSVARGQKEEPDRKDVGRISFLGKFTDGYSSKIPQEIETLIGCNMCWKKEIFVKLGGFDEEFTGNALREEADLSLRARENGYTILFDPKVEILHIRAESGGTRKTEGRIQWYFDFFSNETYFFLKYRPKIVVAIILLTRWEWFLRCMFGFGREVSLRSFITPFAGVIDGYRKYRRWKNEDRS